MNKTTLLLFSRVQFPDKNLSRSPKKLGVRNLTWLHINSQSRTITRTGALEGLLHVLFLLTVMLNRSTADKAGVHNTMKLESPTSLVAVHARKSATVREIVTRRNMSMNADADRQTMLDCTGCTSSRR